MKQPHLRSIAIVIHCILFAMILNLRASGQSRTCASAAVFCGSGAFTYQATCMPPCEGPGSGYPAEPGPCYSGAPNACLATQPNPAWFFLQAGSPGPIELTITSNPPADIDFECWGPFTSPTGACLEGLSCDKIADCSYAGGTGPEICIIPNAQTNEFYMLVLTNYQNIVTFISFQQTNFGQPGAGTTNCSIVIECSILSLTPIPGACNPATGTFDLTGTIEFTNPPTTGTLLLKDISTTPPVQTTINPPFSSPMPYTITGIPCDGLTHQLVASFTGATNPCELSASFQAPVAPCPVGTISGGGILCNDGTSTTTVSVSVNGAPGPYNFTYAINGIGQTPITNYTGPIPYNITTNQPGTYTLQAISNGTCTGTVAGVATVTLINFPAQPVTFNPPFYSCGPGTVSMTVSPVTGVHFNWYDTPAATIPVFTGNNFVTGVLSTTTTFYAEAVTNQGSCACATRTAITAEIRTLPAVANTSRNLSICTGQTPGIALSSVPPTGEFSWNATCTPPGSVTGFAATGTGTVISEILTTTSVVTGTVVYVVTPILNQCSGSPAVFTVTVYPLPQPVITGPGELCMNSSGTFTTLAGMNSYTWQALPDGVFSPGNTNTLLVQFPTAGAKTIKVNYTDPATTCQSTIATYTLVVHPLPVPIISGPTSVCRNTTNHYTTDPGMTGYTWTIDPPGSGSMSPVPGFPEKVDVFWSVFGNQRVRLVYTDQNNCTAAVPSVSTVTVQSLPTPSITSGPASVCTENTHTYTTQSGASAYTWDVQPLGGRTILSGGSGVDDNIVIQWNNAGNYVISINYAIGIGCTAASPTLYTVTVNPKPTPVITSSSGSLICGLSTHTYNTAGGAGHSYLWNLQGGTKTAGGGLNNNFVTVTWGNVLPVSIDLIETINYAGGASCSAPAPAFPISMKPWPDQAGVITGPASVCHTWNNQVYTVPVINNALNYNWYYTGTGASITNNGNSVSIEFLSNSTSGNLTVRGNNDCGEGPASPGYHIEVHPLPTVTLTPCNDLVTTKNAKPFILKGGYPTGVTGLYTIDDPSGTPLPGNLFNPGNPSVTIGNHIIYYSYTNVNNCRASAQSTIMVQSSGAGFSCNLPFTDPRDGSIYATALIGGQCWMKENLRYGISLQSQQPQEDNCLWEHYCMDTDPGCTNRGGLYQWEEIMQYTLTDRAQGLCPPGWHLPNESEWALLISNISLGIGDGVAGSYLKDININGQFKADPAGVFYLNNPASFSSGTPLATLFWTSTAVDPGRAVARGLNNLSPSISYYRASRADAFPVRCLKD